MVLFTVLTYTGVRTDLPLICVCTLNEMPAVGDKYFGSVGGFTTLEEMANHCATLIRGVQPHGLYVIAGHSVA